MAVGLLKAMCMRWFSIDEPLYDAEPKQMLCVLSVIVELRDIVGIRLRLELQLMQRSIVRSRFLFKNKIKVVIVIEKSFLQLKFYLEK